MKLKINKKAISRNNLLLMLIIILIAASIRIFFIQAGTSSEIIFDRSLDCQRCGQHKAPPLTDVKITISAKVTSPVTDAILIDYYPSDWSVEDANGGLIYSFNSSHSKIEWYVGQIDDEITKWYLVKSPDLTSPPTKYYFYSELAGSQSEPWMVIVSDPVIVYNYNFTVSGNKAYGSSNDAGTVNTTAGGDEFTGDLDPAWDDGWSTEYNFTQNGYASLVNTSESTGSCGGSGSCNNIGAQGCCAYGCGWSGGICTGSSTQCSGFQTQSCCEGRGCLWSGGCELGTFGGCGTIFSETCCNDHTACAWSSGSCSGSLSGCGSFTGQTCCQDAGCTWSQPGWRANITSSGANREPHSRYNFTITQNKANIQWINVTAVVQMITGTDDGCIVSVANYTNQDWFNITPLVTSTLDVTASYNFTSSTTFDKIINGTTLTVLISGANSDSDEGCRVNYVGVKVGNFEDTTSPTFTKNNTNTSTPYPNNDVKFYSQWTDDVSLDKYIFSWNGNGTSCNTWWNASATAFQTGNWTNTTVTIPMACEGKNIQYKFFGNDTTNNWNTSYGSITVQNVTRWLELEWDSGSLTNSTVCTSTGPCSYVQYSNLTANATVTCRTNPAGYNCGNVSGSIRYNSSGETPNALVNQTDGAKPFYLVGTSTTISCGVLSNGQSCPLNWTVSATGNGLPQIRAVDANATSNITTITENSTADAYISIIGEGGGDTTPPTWSNIFSNVTNNTAVNTGTPISLGAQWTDDAELSMYVNSTKVNDTGSWTNGTWQSFSAGNWTNFTIIFPSETGSTITVKIFANDTSNNQNVTGVWFWYNVTPEGTTPPTYSKNRTNTTVAGQYCNFSLEWNDDFALGSNGQWIFSTNNSGIWRNFSSTTQIIPNNFSDYAYYTSSAIDSSSPSSAVFTLFSDTTYNSTNVSDDNRYTMSISTSSLTEKYKFKKFTFDLTGFNINDITEIKYCHEGYYEKVAGSGGVSAGLTYYNVGSGSWIDDQSIGSSESTKCKSFTSGFTDIINSTDNKFQFVARLVVYDDGGGSTTGALYTDFVNLTVKTNQTNFTATPQNATFVRKLNPNSGTVVSWCFYAKDNAGNWNGTSCENPFVLTTTTAGCSVAIGLSTALDDGISFGTVTRGETNEALGNNGAGITDYNITIQTSGCSPSTVNVYTKASGDLTYGAKTIAIANETFRNSTTDDTVPATLQNISLTTTYSDNLIGSLLNNGDKIYLKYLLDVPSDQWGGTYTNTIYFWAGRSDLSPP